MYQQLTDSLLCFSSMAWADGWGVIVLPIFHYSVSTERGRLEDEAVCSWIVWFTQVAISQ